VSIISKSFFQKAIEMPEEEEKVPNKITPSDERYMQSLKNPHPQRNSQPLPKPEYLPQA